MLETPFITPYESIRLPGNAEELLDLKKVIRLLSLYVQKRLRNKAKRIKTKIKEDDYNIINED